MSNLIKKIGSLSPVLKGDKFKKTHCIFCIKRINHYNSFGSSLCMNCYKAFYPDRNLLPGDYQINYRSHCAPYYIYELYFRFKRMESKSQYKRRNRNKLLKNK